MLHGTGLSGQTTALDGRHDIELTFAVGDLERLLQDHLEHGTREIRVHVLAVDDNLAGTGLDPDAGDRILALAGGIAAAQLVADRLARGGGVQQDSLATVSGGGRTGSVDGALEVFEGVQLLGHAQALLWFLGFIDLTSSTSGDCASCGWSAEA